MSNLAQKVNALAIQVKALLKNNGVVVIDGFNSTSTTSSSSANTAKALKSLYDGIILKIGLTTGNGIAPTLDGVIPSQYLPSFVDEILEFANILAFPTTGLKSKLYNTLDTNLFYRWSGSTYVLIGDGTSVDVVGVGANAFARYDAAQSLSDAEKAQLLTNIGAKKSYNMLPTKTAAYAPTLADFKDAVDLYDKVYLRMNLTAIGDVTIGTALTSLPNLTEITIRDLGTARATLVEDGTVLNGIKTFSVQNEVKTLVKVGANEWDIIGALS